jgi:hypothetical protein
VHDQLPDSVQVERDGPLVRTYGFGNRGFVEYRDLAGLGSEELDALIARQVQIFAERDEAFEWKLHGHDRPADLPDRLRAAGFVPEGTETVVIGRADAVAGEPSMPDGVLLREVSDPRDLTRIAELEESIWHEEHSWIDDLAVERAADPEGPPHLCCGGRRPHRLRRLAAISLAYGVRHVLGRCDAAELAWTGDLPRARRASSEASSRAGPPLHRGRRLRRQPADPRAAGVCRRDDYDAIRLVAADESGDRVLACPSVAQCPPSGARVSDESAKEPGHAPSCFPLVCYPTVVVGV